MTRWTAAYWTLPPLLGALVVSALVITTSCNAVLGLDERPLRADAGNDGDGTRPLAPDKCSTDADCTAPNGCYTARCDGTFGACAYTLCESKDRTCSAGTCNSATFTCESEREHGFRATSYAIPDATLGCRDPSDCFAAVFPFVFIGTPSSIVALGVESAIASSPRRVGMTSDIRPSRLVVSGRRLWILGDVQGTVPPYQLPIATLDVPSDPTTSGLATKSWLVPYPYPSAVGFAAADGGLYLAYDNAAEGFPTAVLQSPLPESPRLGTAFADGGTSDASTPAPNLPMQRVPTTIPNGVLVASSAARLVVYRVPNVFNIIDAPGTAGASVGADLSLTPAPPLAALPRFARGPDGSVMLVGSVVADAAGDCNCSTHQRLQWVLPNAVATTLDPDQLADVEQYQNPQTPGGACHACTPAPGYFTSPSLAAWLDARTALVAAPGTDPDRTRTAVRLVERDPIAAPPSRRFVIPAGEAPTGDFATDRIALTASGGVGYLLVANGEGNAMSLSIVDPRCDTR